MAIAFPNFLGVTPQAPDYSGIGDAVGNFYSGYNAPKDALIKSIQAQFAKPNAEEALRTSQLNNRAKQLEIQKAVQDIAQQASFQNQLKQALSGGTVSNAGVAQPAAMPSASGMPASATPVSAPSSMPAQGSTPLIHPALTKAIVNNLQTPAASQSPAAVPGQPAQQVGAAPTVSPTGVPQAPMPVQEAPTEANEIVIQKGAPHLAGVDHMWDSNPQSRAFLEKQGFKKSQQIKFDNKTGKTSIITTYPSGKVTIQSSGQQASDEGIPLTNKMITKHQNIISSIDNALPIIKQIQDLNEQESGKNGNLKDKYWEPYPRSSGAHWYTLGLGQVPGWQGQSTKYEALVSSVLDSLIGAYGLPLSNEGLETVKQQLLIGHGETDSAYKKRLENLVNDLERRKQYSSNEVKKSNKIQPIGRMGNSDYSDLDKYDQGGE